MGSTSVGGEGAVRPELPWPELPAPAGWGAVAVAAIERARESSSASRAGTVGAGPAYLAMPARTGYAPQAEAFAPAERGYAGAATVVGASSAAAPSNTTSAKATAAASQSSGSKSAARTSSSTSKTSSSKSSTSKSSTSKSSTSKSTSTSKTSTSKAASAELAFLDDPNVSVEDKLFRFMTVMQKKADAELVDAMKRYEEKKAAADKGSSSSSSAGKTGSSTSSSPPPEKKESGGGGGGGLFGMLGDALGGIAKTVVSGAESLAKDLGGPLLAAGATAVGLPFLAPVALQIGGTLAKSAVSGLASAVGLDELGKSSTSSGTSSGSSSKATTSSASSSEAKTTSTAKATSTSTSKAATADDGVFDEKLEMLGLQRLVEKQQTMFAALSNVLKAQHDGQMVAVNNIR